jgi:hypothetical protein
MRPRQTVRRVPGLSSALVNTPIAQPTSHRRIFFLMMHRPELGGHKSAHGNALGSQRNPLDFLSARPDRR